MEKSAEETLRKDEKEEMEGTEGLDESGVLSRRAMIGTMLAAGVSAVSLASSTNDGRIRAIEKAIEKGRDFLGKLYDPGMDLLPEFEGSKTYWLFHDNYLAAKALGKVDPEKARKIQARMKAFGVEKSGKIEIVHGEANDPLPFRQYELVEVARVGEKVVRTERVTSRVFVGWEAYGDLLLLASIAEKNARKAVEYFDRAARMWDGVGVKDRVAAHGGIYATYKVALVLIASDALKRPAGFVEAARKRLLSLQGASGGWITDYKSDGTPVGMANVETTCLAMVGLKAVATSASK